MNIFKLLILSSVIIISSCTKPTCTEPVTEETPYVSKTKNVVILVMDGARYSETWGDDTHQYIPYLSNLMQPKGTINTAFYNDGYTLTAPGHTAMTTGIQQNIDNTGSQLPDFPSIFQYYIKESNADSTDAWIITSKDKLEVLSDCIDTAWAGKYRPATDCGVNGLGTGYRHDSITYRKITEILGQYHPHLVLINLREPDFSGHTGVWASYTKGIESSDYYAFKILQFLELDPVYANSTAFLLVNDHGRHLDTVSTGFTSHGDGCDGCRHILFYANGPDFYSNKIISTHYSLIDIPTTTADLLGFDFPTGEGKVMSDIFINKP